MVGSVSVIAYVHQQHSAPEDRPAENRRTTRCSRACRRLLRSRFQARLQRQR
jgi:hypothetical protein